MEGARSLPRPSSALHKKHDELSHVPGPPVILPCSSTMPSSSFESANAVFFLPAAAVAISANNGDSTLLTTTVTGKGEEPMSASPKASNTTQETFSPLESHPQTRVTSSTECDQEAERQQEAEGHPQIQTQIQQEQQQKPHMAASSELMQVEEGSYSAASAAAPASTAAPPSASSTGFAAEAPRDELSLQLKESETVPAAKRSWRPGGRHENMKTWTPQEDRLLLQAVDRLGKRWKGVQGTHPLLQTRTISCIRNRYQRMAKGFLARREGIAKNLCQACGQPRRGHTCTGARYAFDWTSRALLGGTAGPGGTPLPTEGANGADGMSEEEEEVEEVGEEEEEEEEEMMEVGAAATGGVATAAAAVAAAVAAMGASTSPVGAPSGLVDLVRGLQRDFGDELCPSLPSSCGLLQVIQALEAAVLGDTDPEAAACREREPLRARALSLSRILNGAV